MRIALASARFINGNIAFNLGQIDRYMREAKAQGAELACFGETFLQGFDALTWKYAEDREVAVATDSEVFLELCRRTEELGIDLLLGFLERDGESIYSSCALLGGGKLLHLYRRVSEGWKEYWRTDGHYREGETVSLFSYRGKRCCIALCGDLWEFPERFRLGEDLLLWPVYVDFTPKEWQEQYLSEYARQAALACGDTLLINSVTAMPDEVCFGGCARFLDGTVGTVLPPGEEGLLIVEV